MKLNEEEVRLGQLLKEQAHQATPNRWFTRRVLNRLPARRRHQGFIAIVYALVAAVCIFSWRDMLGTMDGVFTVRQLLYLAIAVLITIMAVVSAILTTVRSD